MHGNYKLEEKIIKDIIMRNTKYKNENDQLYKKKQTY